MPRGGNNRKPTQRHLLAGTHRKDRHGAAPPMRVIRGAVEPPEPMRPLEQAGAELWDRVWRSGASWLLPDVDCFAVQLLCEQIDERRELHASVVRDGEWRARVALRQLDKAIVASFASLGFNPTDRARLNVGEVKPVSKLDKFLEQRDEDA